MFPDHARESEAAFFIQCFWVTVLSWKNKADHDESHHPGPEIKTPSEKLATRSLNVCFLCFKHAGSNLSPQKVRPASAFQTLPFLFLSASLQCLLMCWASKVLPYFSLPLPNGKICKSHFVALEVLPRWRQTPRPQTAWTLPLYCPCCSRVTTERKERPGPSVPGPGEPASQKSVE